MAPVLVTMGEPAGIGAEILVTAWRQRLADDLPVFAALDDPQRLRARWPDLPLAVIGNPGDAAAVFDRALPVLPLSRPVTGQPGAPAPADAALVIEAIDRAVDACLDGSATAMVTSPINKKLLYEAGFRHPGHTEYIGDRCGVADPVMMIAGPSVRVVPATIHIPIRDVPDALSTDALIRLGQTVAAALDRDFGCAPQRIAFAGLNPHAGEQGALGTEDSRIIAPAVAALQAAGIAATGPLPADTMFHAAARKGYDAAICMYHDQALAPAKALDFDQGVNVTLGLPIIRTSPDHGTAFDIAGRGIARADSLIAAIRMAGEMANRRRARRQEAAR